MVQPNMIWYRHNSPHSARLSSKIDCPIFCFHSFKHGSTVEFQALGPENKGDLQCKAVPGKAIYQLILPRCGRGIPWLFPGKHRLLGFYPWHWARERKEERERIREREREREGERERDQGGLLTDLWSATINFAEIPKLSDWPRTLTR